MILLHRLRTYLLRHPYTVTPIIPREQQDIQAKEWKIILGTNTFRNPLEEGRCLLRSVTTSRPNSLLTRLAGQTVTPSGQGRCYGEGKQSIMEVVNNNSKRATWKLQVCRGERAGVKLQVCRDERMGVRLQVCWGEWAGVRLLSTPSPEHCFIEVC